MMLAAVAGSCGDPFPPASDPGWVEVRTPCTLSHDHDLTYIRVWADPLAHDPYTNLGSSPYPVGATLLKGMYRDERCEQLVSWVTMEKLPEGTAPEEYDWDWHRFDDDGSEIIDPRRIPYTCIDCHAWHCAEPPYGFDLSCTPNGPEPITPPPGG